MTSKKRHVRLYTLVLSILLSFIVLGGGGCIFCKLHSLSEGKAPRLLSEPIHSNEQPSASPGVLFDELHNLERIESAEGNLKVREAVETLSLEQQLEEQEEVDSSPDIRTESDVYKEVEQQREDLQAFLDAKAEQEIQAMGGVEITNEHEIFVNESELYSPQVISPVDTGVSNPTPEETPSQFSD